MVLLVVLIKFLLEINGFLLLLLRGLIRCGGISYGIRVFLQKSTFSSGGSFMGFTPTNLNLGRRKVPILPWCMWCGKCYESKFHAFFKCKRASVVLMQNCPNVLCLAGSWLSRKDFQLFGVTCQEIWDDRNNLNQIYLITPVCCRVKWILHYCYEVARTVVVSGDRRGDKHSGG